MPRKPANNETRRGTAAVELALVAPLLMGLLLGVWQIGQLIMVQQIVSTAAREGARIAAQGQTVQGNTIQNVYASTASATANGATGAANVQTIVLNYLQEAGISTTNVTVTFTYLTGTTSYTDPYQGTQGQQFMVTVTVPYSNFGWTNNFGTGVNLTATAVWTSLSDSPFTINTSIPY